MRIKILVLSLVISALAIAASGSTLAYFTDADLSVNTFTVGNVKVENITATSKNHTAGDCLVMQKSDVCTKTFSVLNTGLSDAYIRVRILVPEILLSATSPDISVEPDAGVFATVDTEEVGGINYRVYTNTWSTALSSESTSTEATINITYLKDSTASVPGEGGSTPGENTTPFGILVYTEAIQAQGFDNAIAAFANFN